MYTVHCFTGLLGEDMHRLFVILSVFLHLNTVTPLLLSANDSHSPLKGLCVYHNISHHSCASADSDQRFTLAYAAGDWHGLMSGESIRNHNFLPNMLAELQAQLVPGSMEAIQGYTSC